jgi:hypothetical protein
MNTLFTFGCSFTEDFTEVPPDMGQTIYVMDYLNGRVPDAWPTVLSKLLSFDVQNFGKGGSSNYQIFDVICQQCSKFNKGDIVIIGWTGLNRFRWANFDEDKWNHIIPNFNTKVHNEVYITDNTLNEILVNREHSLYVDEIYSYQKMIDRLAEVVGFDVYYWAMDNRIINSLPPETLCDKKYLCGHLISQGQSIPRLINIGGGKTIMDETNNLIVDYHYGETGHQVQGELFYKHIKDLL